MSTTAAAPAPHDPDAIAVKVSLRGEERFIGEPNWEAAETILDAIADIFRAMPTLRVDMGQIKTSFAEQKVQAGVFDFAAVLGPDVWSAVKPYVSRLVAVCWMNDAEWDAAGAAADAAIEQKAAWVRRAPATQVAAAFLVICDIAVKLIEAASELDMGKRLMAVEDAVRPPQQSTPEPAGSDEQ